MLVHLSMQKLYLYRSSTLMGGTRLGVAWCSEVLRRPRSSVSGFCCSCVRWMRRFFFHCMHNEAAFAASVLGSGCLRPLHIEKNIQHYFIFTGYIQYLSQKMQNNRSHVCFCFFNVFSFLHSAFIL